MESTQSPERGEGMPYVIFNIGERCPHCENNEHHNHVNNQNPHACEFCNRIDASRQAYMTIEFYEKAVKANWKEILMFGMLKER